MLLGGGLTSCIREDLDDCFSTNKLVLSYKGDGDKEIFPDKICRVEMYVFNAENQCVNSSVLPEDQVKAAPPCCLRSRRANTGSSAWETPTTQR